MFMNLAALKTILIDGMIWHDNEVVPSALDFFDLLQQRGMGWALLINNNARTVADYVCRVP